MKTAEQNVLLGLLALAALLYFSKRATADIGGAAGDSGTFVPGGGDFGGHGVTGSWLTLQNPIL